MQWRNWAAVAMACACIAAAPGAKPIGNSQAPAEQSQIAIDREARAEDVELARQDLAVQDRMADAAEALTDLTRWQMWVGIAGTLAVVVSLWVSAAAAWAGFRAAKAAEDALVAQERPRLMVKQISISALDTEFAGLAGGLTPFTLTFENHGNGTAWIRKWYHAMVVDGREGDVPTLTFEPRPARTARWPITKGTGWGMLNDSGTFEISEEQRASIFAGRSKFYIYGAVHYESSDGHPYVLQFVYRYRLSDRRMEPIEHEWWKAD